MSTSKFEIDNVKSLTISQCVQKRLFDVIFSICGIVIFFIIIFIAWIVASIDTKSNGFFCQTRIGRNGKKFTMYKIKTMINSDTNNTSVTTRNDPRITKIGGFFRRTKIDELPQLWNVFTGKMSVVGPRPDVSGFADKLMGVESLILTIRPGITGPAAIKYRHEEALLADKLNPNKYNREVIWPDKIAVNLEYIHNWSLLLDIKYIFITVLKK